MRAREKIDGEENFGARSAEAYWLRLSMKFRRKENGTGDREEISLVSLILIYLP